MQGFPEIEGDRRVAHKEGMGERNGEMQGALGVCNALGLQQQLIVLSSCLLKFTVSNVCRLVLEGKFPNQINY